MKRLLAFTVMILFLAVLLAGCTGAEDTPSTQPTRSDEAGNTATRTPSPTKTVATPAPAKGVQVKIDYPGSWSGAIGYSSNIKTVDGAGPQSFDISDPGWFVSVNAQKKDDSSRILTVTILKNGKVLGTENTQAAYGVAMTSASI